jgi:arginyl-tRNA synthetase
VPAFPLSELAARITRQAADLVGHEPAEVPLSPPAQREHGDLATPVAMAMAKRAKRPPREIAEGLVAALAGDPQAARWIARAEVAGPGFVNLTLSPAWFADTVEAILAGGDRFGAGAVEPRERILVEFVSANPTGALHVGHARQAAYGDSLARTLAFAGHEVTREYYVNDQGRQMRSFGASVAWRYGQLHGVELPMPEEGYPGEDVLEVARRVDAEVGDRFVGRLDPLDDEALTVFTERGGQVMLELIREELERFRVRMDSWFSELSMHESGRVREGLEALQRAGDAYEQDGALWFATTRYDDEKDRVLVRGDGTTTYLASDVAYHLDKAGRDHDRLIDVLGADHHGYVARLRAVLEAGGHSGDMLEVSLLQLVSLVERGEAKRMSKRAGTVVTLSDLLDDIGVDAARFFLVQRSHDTPLELDLDLARERSQENPVYYVQYAHARGASILRQVGQIPEGQPPPETLDESERALVLQVAAWPGALAEAESKRAPHRIAAYLVDLARDFHAFYHRCRVAGEPDDILAFRARLTQATGTVIRTGLDLLGVEAPDRM